MIDLYTASTPNGWKVTVEVTPVDVRESTFTPRASIADTTLDDKYTKEILDESTSLVCRLWSGALLFNASRPG
ncbi:MAG TPA: hypothetical protein VHW69_09000 [Rhizomicrobium sp.]|jgi:hypothetical protein|nr:hypothetical protein [Rhizomicrobium sp.]